MPRGNCPLVHRSPNPPHLPGQPSTLLAVVDLTVKASAGIRLLPMASVNMADEAGIVVNIAEALTAEVSWNQVAEVCRKLHTFDTRPLDVAVLA